MEPGEFSVGCNPQGLTQGYFQQLFRRVFVPVVGCFIWGCGGQMAQVTPTAPSTSQTNLIHFKGALGSTIRLQLWVAKHQVTEKSASVPKDCPQVPVRFKFLERPEAIGLSVEGFPKELEQDLSILINRPQCVFAFVSTAPNSAERHWLTRLGHHLTQDQFGVATLSSSTSVSPTLSKQLETLVTTAVNQPSRAPIVFSKTSVALRTYETKSQGELECQLNMVVDNPEGLAHLELAVAALQEALSNQTGPYYQPYFSRIQLQPSSEGFFTLSVQFNLPTRLLKSQLPKILGLLTKRISRWASPMRMLNARRTSLNALLEEKDYPRSYLERTARTNLIFGRKGPDQWHRALHEVGYAGWITGITPWFHPKKMHVNVGLSKDTLSEKDFEIAFFKEALEEQLESLEKAASPPMASSNSKKLIVMERKEHRQHLRLVIGLPVHARSTLTPYVLANVEHCLKARSRHPLQVDLVAGTLVLQTDFKAAELSAVLDQWKLLIQSPCTPLVMPEDTSQQPSALDIVHRAQQMGDPTPDSGGTSISARDNRLSPRIWWQHLFAAEPPLQFFSAGPIPRSQLSHAIHDWQPWKTEKSWRENKNTRLGLELAAGRSLIYENHLLVPFHNLSPRRRMLLDAVCAFVTLDRDSPAQCKRIRSVYLGGADIITFEPRLRTTKQTVRERLKTYFFNVGNKDPRLVRSALRTVVLEHERMANASSSTVEWLQNVVWEPDQAWRHKMVWDGLFPEENADTELMSLMKTLATRHL